MSTYSGDEDTSWDDEPDGDEDERCEHGNFWDDECLDCEEELAYDEDEDDPGSR